MIIIDDVCLFTSACWCCDAERLVEGSKHFEDRSWANGLLNLGVNLAQGKYVTGHVTNESSLCVGTPVTIVGASKYVLNTPSPHTHAHNHHSGIVCAGCDTCVTSRCDVAGGTCGSEPVARASEWNVHQIRSTCGGRLAVSGTSGALCAAAKAAACSDRRVHL